MEALQVSVNASLAMDSTVAPTKHHHVKDHAHQSLHEFIGYSIIIFVIVTQICLNIWKKKYPRSFQIVNLFGLWLFPFIISVMNLFWRMIIVWFLFTSVTVYMFHLANQNPLQKSTPRKVYTWFYLIYRLSYTVVAIGYILFILDIFLSLSIPLLRGVGITGVTLIFYGLYFGVLLRDCANVCTDSIARAKGLSTGKDIPNKIVTRNSCGICGDDLQGPQQTATLACNHSYHEFCICGWAMIGKKDSCPQCTEKVDIKSFFKQPWQIQGAYYLFLLDMLHYLFVWNPLVVLCIRVFMYLVDYEHS